MAKEETVRDRFNNENEIIDYLENYGYDKTRPGLERTRELLERLGDPQKKLRFIHVAGTNGKGSVCAMLYSILDHAGYRTGLYPSPYLVDFKERIQANGHNISVDDLVRIGNIVVNECDRMEDHPTYFEMVTAIAMIYYAENKCDVVILETGMGGRLDSTNVIESPLVSIITNIGMDHMDHLGSTIEEIAGEKAGIIKAGSPVVSYDNIPSVRNVLTAKAQSLGCDIYYPRKDMLRGTGFSIEDESQTFEYEGRNYTLSLLGKNQLKNVEVVLTAVKVLNNNGIVISDDDIRTGLMNTVWPARFQIMSHDPLLILDGGHNEQCARALLDNINEYFGDTRVTFLMGMLRDKDYEKVVKILVDRGEQFIIVTPHSVRALEAAELAATVTNSGGTNVTVCGSIKDAVKISGQSKLTVCFGSLYLAGEVLRYEKELFDN